MRVDVTELAPDGTVVSIMPAVDLAEAVPDADEHAHVMADLGRFGAAHIGGGAAPHYRLTLARKLPAGLRPARIRLRIRPKPAPPAPVDPLARRIAAVMLDRAAVTGACSLLDLRQAGISRVQALRHADAARELVGRDFAAA